MSEASDTQKICARCARVIEPRKKWARNWEQIKYCSDQCRKNSYAQSYELRILNLLRTRGTGKTICPSELLADSDKKNKALMEKVRISARHLVSRGVIVITQKGQIVDPSTAKGPIRLKLKN